MSQPDSTYDFTIAAAAGKARITGVTAPTSAGVGTQLDIKVELINDGDTDKLWVQVKDRTTNAIINDINGYPCRQVTGVPITKGSTSAHFFRVTMPSVSSWSLRAEAGHGTTAGLLLDTYRDFGITRGLALAMAPLTSLLAGLRIPTPQMPTLELPTITWTDLSMAMGFIGIATVGAVIVADQLMRR